VGGENYTNPQSFGHALFAGPVFIERLPPEQVPGFIDVPRGHADLDFIQRCALALTTAR